MLFRHGMCHLIWVNRHPVPLLVLNYFYRQHILKWECCAKIWNYTWFVWPFYTLIDFYMHYLTCTIQIRTTIRRSGASKWVENHISVHASLGPMQDMGMNFNHLGVLARREKHWETQVLKYVNQKTRQKIHETWLAAMNLAHKGVISFCFPIWDSFFNIFFLLEPTLRILR